MSKSNLVGVKRIGNGSIQRCTNNTTVKSTQNLKDKILEFNKLYSPCKCNSGKKYKFCCKQKD